MFELLVESEPADGARLASNATCSPIEEMTEGRGYLTDSLASVCVAWSSAEWTPLSRALASVELFAESGSCGDLVLAIELMAVGPAGNLRI